MTSPRRAGGRPHVVVVGGGVIGVCCAYYLVSGGARVTLLERAEIASGASSGNAGTVSAGHPPLNRPGRIGQALSQMMDPASPLYVKPRWDPHLWRWLLGFARYCSDDHVRHCMQVMAPLGKDALVLFQELIAEERIECGYRADGYYDVCSSDAGFASARQEAGMIEAHGYHPETLTGDELRRREPAFAEGLIGGVYYPEAATLRPSDFVHRLCNVVRRQGTDVRECVSVSEVLERGGVAQGVRLTSGETVPADAVVLTTGPFSLDMVARFGVSLPVVPGKGYHADIDVGPNGAPALGVACVLHESSVFCTPMDTFVRFAGTMEFSGENLILRPARLRQLTAAGRRCFPSLGSARPISKWCGLRPMSVDGLPIVGPVPGVEGLTVATGHGMLGLTLGPVTGQMIAGHVLRGGDARMASLSPARFRRG